MKPDKSDLIFVGLAAGAGLVCLRLGGWSAVHAAIMQALRLFTMVAPMLVAGLLIGGLIRVLVNRDRIARLLGEQSGVKGLIYASIAGMLTPGGPFTSFPLVHALWLAGADAGALVAYVAGWSLIGLSRLLVWELPLMGVEFSLLRFVVSLPMPILAGLIARWLVRATPLKLKH